MNERDRRIEDLHERNDMILRAMRLIEDAEELVREAITDTGERPHAEAYLIPVFNDLLGTGNPYNASLRGLIDNFDKEIERLIEEEEEERKTVLKRLVEKAEERKAGLK